MNRATYLANQHSGHLPDMKANGWLNSPATASMYEDGVVLYVRCDSDALKVAEAITKGIAVEQGQSDDGNVAVFILPNVGILNRIAEAMPLTFNDCTGFDSNTIDLYCRQCGMVADDPTRRLEQAQNIGEILDILSGDEYELKDAKGKTVAIGPFEMMGRWIKQMCPDGDYTLEQSGGTDLIVEKRGGVCYPTAGRYKGQTMPPRTMEEAQVFFET